MLVVDRPREVAGRGQGRGHSTRASTCSRGVLEQRRPARVGGGIGTMSSSASSTPTVSSSLARSTEVARLFAEPARRRRPDGRHHRERARRACIERCQDLEFVGFSHLAQAARDRIGSVGLGGNGQFTRLSAAALARQAPGRLPDRGSRSGSQSHRARLADPLLPDDLGDAARGARRSGPGFASGRAGPRGTTSAGITSRSCSRRPGTPP